MYIITTNYTNYTNWLRSIQSILKKLVKNNGFWRINALWPKIKAKRGRMRKYKNEGSAKYGGLVKELGFLFVTQIQVTEES